MGAAGLLGARPGQSSRSREPGGVQAALQAHWPPSRSCWTAGVCYEHITSSLAPGFGSGTARGMSGRHRERKNLREQSIPLLSRPHPIRAVQGRCAHGLLAPLPRSILSCTPLPLRGAWSAHHPICLAHLSNESFIRLCSNYPILSVPTASC